MSSTGSGQPEMDSGGSRPQTAQAAQQDLAQMLDWAAAPGGSTLAPADLPGASESHEPEIGGRYRLLEAIGEGGFGTVFRAQQTQPVRREVAIKLIKLGMDTRALIARFEAERQALAMMDHPSVAKVYDAGSTRQGRPFFAMELVQGEPITDYCRKSDLATRQRLELFIQVCNAVAHAHTKGIIHRDLKPNNVLVSVHDGKPLPKVIDFGIAKATAGSLTDGTLYTEHRQFIGTPQYMSPEQALRGGADVDTRTDIYSLGVLLYELLTGVAPFDSRRLRSATHEEIQRIIREEEPPRPSTRVASTRLGDTAIADDSNAQPSAGNTSSRSRQLARELRGDLDWIIMKAMDKDRTRRYETAGALAADVQRHLSDEPVEASPPSVAYRFGKFARRHTGVLIATGAVAVALVGGLALATVGLLQARREAIRAQDAEQDALEQRDAAQRAEKDAVAARDEAREAQEDAMDERDAAERARIDALAARDESEEVTRFLVQMLTAADPSALGREVTVREVVDIAARDLPQRFASRPLVEARLNDAVGRTYLSLGVLPEAESHLNLAVEARQKLRGPSHEETLRSMMDLAGVYHTAERFAEGQVLMEQVLQRATESLGPDHELTLTAIDTLGAMHRGQGHYQAAEQFFREAVERMTEILGPERDATVNAMHNLAFVIQTQGRYQESLPLTEEVVRLRERLLGPEHPETLLSKVNLGALYSRTGRASEAAVLLEEILEASRRVMGQEHPRTIIAAINLGSACFALKDFDRVMEILEWRYDIASRRHGENSLEVMEVLESMAAVDREQGQLEEAELKMRRVMETLRSQAGPKDNRTLGAMNNLAGVLVGQKKWDEAFSLIEEALAIRSTVFGDAHPESVRMLRNLALMYRTHKRYEESARYFVRLVGASRTLYGREDSRTAEVTVGAAAVLLQVKDYPRAEEYALEGYERYRQSFGQTSERTISVAQLLAKLYDAWGKPQEAARWHALSPSTQPAPAAQQPAPASQPAQHQ